MQSSATAHLITLMDWEPERIARVLSLAHELKAQARAGTLRPALARKTLALVFEKASMRTRVSQPAPTTQSHLLASKPLSASSSLSIRLR